MASYPTSLPTFHAVPATLAGPPSHEAVHEQLADELNAALGELGTNPSGDSLTVAARLNTLGRVVAYAEATANQTGIGTTLVDLTGLSVTFTAVSGRLYLVQAFGVFAAEATAVSATMLVLQDGGAIGLAGCDVTTTHARSCSFQRRRSLTAGSHTFKAQAAANAGTIKADAAYGLAGSLVVWEI